MLRFYFYASFLGDDCIIFKTSIIPATFFIHFNISNIQYRFVNWSCACSWNTALLSGKILSLAKLTFVERSHKHTGLYIYSY